MRMKYKTCQGGSCLHNECKDLSLCPVYFPLNFYGELHIAVPENKSEVSNMGKHKKIHPIE
jgi:hypothetical protein